LQLLGGPETLSAGARMRERHAPKDQNIALLPTQQCAIGEENPGLERHLIAPLAIRAEV
jgi:hypothetical protein